jgi:hypothetical protein
MPRVENCERSLFIEPTGVTNVNLSGLYIYIYIYIYE